MSLWWFYEFAEFKKKQLNAFFFVFSCFFCSESRMTRITRKNADKIPTSVSIAAD